MVKDGSNVERVAGLVRDYGERAYQFAYRLTGDADLAQDLVQESYRRVLHHWDRYDPAQPVENWFFSILRHLFLDAARRYERAHVVSLDAPVVREDGEPTTYAELLPSHEEEVWARLERQDHMQAVRWAMQRLSVEARAVLTMCDVEGMRYEEIAQVLDCPVGTVRSRLNRARGVLKRLLLEWEGMGGGG